MAAEDLKLKLKMQRKAAGGTYSSVTHSQLYKEANDNTFDTFSATWVQNVAAGDVFRWINNNASHNVGRIHLLLFNMPKTLRNKRKNKRKWNELVPVENRFLS